MEKLARLIEMDKDAARRGVIAQRVVDALTRRNWSQTRLANEAGLTQQYVNGVVQGKEPSAYKVARVAAALGVSIDYLLGIEDEENGTTAADGTHMGLSAGAVREIAADSVSENIVGEERLRVIDALLVTDEGRYFLDHMARYLRFCEWTESVPGSAQISISPALADGTPLFDGGDDVTAAAVDGMYRSPAEICIKLIGAGWRNRSKRNAALGVTEDRCMEENRN